jgi:small subunit ribosomal protein S20
LRGGILAKRTISTKKRARQSEKRRQHSRLRKLSLKKVIKELQATKTKESAKTILKKAQALIDKSAQKGIIHRNKAARIKSRLSVYTAKLK